ncbi:hypothetical protein SAMN05216269_101197 [Flavobacterium xinjiangense]|uniref:Uncharacterized protein n=1 Tax=Flavobacterium xinjiangense TaxID=178356 RepID=A0A1M7DQU3_9FLAO|nr:hypothetical protein SAMN05216269_101197 [Flavobacterium xinjiangense]
MLKKVKDETLNLFPFNLILFFKIDHLNNMRV